MTTTTRPSGKKANRPARPPSGAPAGRLYGGQSEDERRGERRGRFLEAGIVQFGQHGFAGVTTRSLCAEAGLTQRYFYESFADIEALFHGVLRVLGERLEALLLGASANESDKPEVQLRAALSGYFQLLKGDENVARIVLLEVFTAGPHTGELALRFNARLSEMLRVRMDAAFPALRERGALSQLMAAALIGGTHHLALTWMRGGYRESVGTVVNTAFTMYLGSALGLASSVARR